MDKKELKSNVTDSNQWLRILYMALFAVILYLVMTILCFVVIIQIIFSLLTGESNKEIRRFSGDLVLYLRDIAAFLTYTTNTKPYPFQAWQVAETESEFINAEYETQVSEEADKSDTDFNK